MTEAESEVIREIEHVVQEGGTISAATIKSWLAHFRSVEVLGAITVHIVSDARRVDPPLSMEETCSIVEEYYTQCLIQNLQDSEYAPNRSIAGLEFVAWFNSLWYDRAVPREYVMRLKMTLRELCLDPKIPRTQMVGAVLEHLFETPEIAEFFGDWRTDPRLKESFDAAMEWAKGHQPPNLPQS